MLDVRKLKYFYYSQNSLNTFNKCPLKFKMKYIDNMSWKNYSPIDIEYYKNIKVGLDFHLVCERYFSKIPLGIDSLEDEILLWVKKLQTMMPLKDGYIYLPEHEIRMIKGNVRLQAKYDLIIIKPCGEIEIWDWKTENRKLNHEEMESRFQTIVYMFLLREKAKKVLKLDIKAENIKMKFWQPKFYEDIIEISYAEHKHIENENIIEEIISKINNYDFELYFNKNLYMKHCKFCEFNYLCNNSRVNFNLLDNKGI